MNVSMSFLLALFCLVKTVSTTNPLLPEIVRYQQPSLYRQERGFPGRRVTGSYSWISPEGENIVVEYAADELGYRIISQTAQPRSIGGQKQSVNVAKSQTEKTNTKKFEHLSNVPDTSNTQPEQRQNITDNQVNITKAEQLLNKTQNPWQKVKAPASPIPLNFFGTPQHGAYPAGLFQVNIPQKLHSFSPPTSRSSLGEQLAISPFVSPPQQSPKQESLTYTLQRLLDGLLKQTPHSPSSSVAVSADVTTSQQTPAVLLPTSVVNMPSKS